MDATETLRHEHRAIEIVLRTMEAAARRLRTGQDVDPSLIADSLDFVTGFADRCHHAKEEELLFPLLEERGVPREGGPISVMLHEHEKGRGFIQDIRRTLPEWQAGDESARSELAVALEGYAELLRYHIAKEDGVLFPMAQRVLSEEDNDRLAKGFDEVEENKIGPGVHERYHQMLDSLEERAKDL